MNKKHNKKDILQYSLDELLYGEEEDEGTELDMKSADPELQKMLALAINMRALHSYDAAKAEAFKKRLRARLLNEFHQYSQESPLQNPLSTAICTLRLQTAHRFSPYLLLIRLRRAFAVFARSVQISRRNWLLQRAPEQPSWAYRIFSFFRSFFPVKIVPVYATVLFFLVTISFSFFQYQKHSTINNLKTMIADLSTSSSTFVNNEIDLNKAFDTVELEDLEFLLTHKNLVESELTLELLELSYDLENFDTESSEEEINTVTFDPHLS